MVRLDHTPSPSISPMVSAVPSKPSAMVESEKEPPPRLERRNTPPVTAVAPGSPLGPEAAGKGPVEAEALDGEAGGEGAEGGSGGVAGGLDGGGGGGVTAHTMTSSGRASPSASSHPRSVVVRAVSLPESVIDVNEPPSFRRS
jgi:hypothetical protein